jgi:hypothetical protein
MLSFLASVRSRIRRALAEKNRFRRRTETHLAVRRINLGVLAIDEAFFAMNRDLKRLLFAGSVIVFVTGILLVHRAPEPQERTAVEVSATIPQADSALTAQLLRQRFQSRREQTAVAPQEPPEDPDEAREWARNNPHDALAWMLNAPAGDMRDTVAEMACAKIAQSDPARAVSLAEAYSGGCSNLLENLVHQWAEQDERAAATYASAKAPGAERDRLLSRVAFVRSKLNPAEGAKLVAQQISPGEVQNEAAISVLHQWALQDPNAALAWAQSFPEEGLRTRAIAEVKPMLPRLPE